MTNKLIVPFILLSSLKMLAHFSCSSNSKNESQTKIDSDNILEYYSSQSKYTDPGKYEYLYESIPSDVSQIVNIVQGVLLHLAQVEIVCRVGRRPTISTPCQVKLETEICASQIQLETQSRISQT